MVSFGPAKMLRVRKESSLHTNTQAELTVQHTVHTTCRGTHPRTSDFPL
jgi:hypothetical protein